MSSRPRPSPPGVTQSFLSVPAPTQVLCCSDAICSGSSQSHPSRHARASCCSFVLSIPAPPPGPTPRPSLRAHAPCYSCAPSRSRGSGSSVCAAYDTLGAPRGPCHARPALSTPGFGSGGARGRGAVPSVVGAGRTRVRTKRKTRRSCSAPRPSCPSTRSACASCILTSDARPEKSLGAQVKDGARARTEEGGRKGRGPDGGNVLVLPGSRRTEGGGGRNRGGGDA